MKDRIECLLAFMIIGTFCLLVGYEKIPAASFVPIAMYVVKKFMDGLEKGSK